ncbi:TetR/AcrR family transcriptional regulator [Thermanaeromonas sp. C210]|uniref:TetR/AcrR family transcriptional regulator n=1 Tax=Thermanaeromonas sp. C210 TaxID=2731925 RepID=UPI0020B64FF0|nr:TetR/AcrR family transcriptional regulator [Thermanaeromonas sp. C210]
MPRSRHGSREIILAAAEEIFAAKGLEGARVDEIAARANINKRMLYHYFQSKEDLYTAVLKSNFEKLLALGGRAITRSPDPVEQVRAIITSFFYFLAANPHYPRLLSWEALQGGVHARKVLPPIWEQGVPNLKAIIEQGMARGPFRPDLDIRQLATTIHTLCTSYFMEKDILAILWKDEPTSPENLKKRLEHILDLVLRYILANP